MCSLRGLHLGDLFIVVNRNAVDSGITLAIGVTQCGQHVTEYARLYLFGFTIIVEITLGTKSNWQDLLC